MKKLIILFLFFSTAFAQQKDTLPVQLNYGGITITGTLIIPHQQGNGNVTKSQLDSGLANKALQVPTQNAINLKQDKLIQGANISISANNVISATGGGTGEGDTINLGEQKQWKFFKPFNYNFIYPNGRQQGGWGMLGYSTHENVNPDGIPDQVWQDGASYNSFPNGARINSKDISTSSRTELYYLIPGIGYCIERHFLEFTDENGKTHRMFSYYGLRKDGTQGFIEMEGTFSLFIVKPDGTRKQYFTTNDAAVYLTATQAGRKIGFVASSTFDNSSVELSSTGGIGKLAFNQIYWDGFNTLIAPLPVYTDNINARANNAKINQWYKDNNGFVRIVQ